jgi:hypothetical protein
MVVKVNLGNKWKEAAGRAAAVSAAADPLGAAAAAVAEGGSISQQSYPTATAVYRNLPHPSNTSSSSSSSRSGSSSTGGTSQHSQRCWYVFDPARVLPEYLVRFEYEVKPNTPIATNSSGTSSSVGNRQVGSTNSANSSSGGSSLVPAAAVAAARDGLADPALRPVTEPLLPWVALQKSPGQLQLSPAAVKLKDSCRRLLVAAQANIEAGEGIGGNQLASLLPSSLQVGGGGRGLHNNNQYGYYIST